VQRASSLRRLFISQKPETTAAGKLPTLEEIIDRIGRDSKEFGSHLDIEDLGSPGECEAGPAFFLVFGRHRYVFIWDYLVLIRLNHVFIWGQSIMGTPFSKNFEPLQSRTHQGTMQRIIHQIKLMPVSAAGGWGDPRPFL
jgi:hypothetical protein